VVAVDELSTEMPPDEPIPARDEDPHSEHLRGTEGVLGRSYSTVSGAPESATRDIVSCGVR
jgi:hypothetical protein